MSNIKIALLGGLIFSLPIGVGLLHYYPPPTHEQKVEFLLLALFWTNMLVKRR